MLYFKREKDKSCAIIDFEVVNIHHFGEKLKTKNVKTAKPAECYFDLHVYPSLVRGTLSIARKRCGRAVGYEFKARTANFLPRVLGLEIKTIGGNGR